MNCKNCNKPLSAINMSDIDKVLCQKCAAQLLKTFDLSEDPELRGVPTWRLDEMMADLKEGFVHSNEYMSMMR